MTQYAAGKVMRVNMALLLSTFNMVVPLFVVVLVGYLLRLYHVVPEDLAAPLNNLCFKILIPCLCVKSMQSVTLDISYLWMAVYMAATFLISIPILCRIVPKWIPVSGQAGSVVQGAFRSNSVLFAMPLMISICGEEHVGPMIVNVALAAVLFNATAVVVLAHFSETGAGRNLRLSAMLRQIVTNPIILGTAVGLIVRFLPFSLPQVILTPVFDLGSCATPMAMLAIGLRFSFKSVSSNRKAIAISTLVKLIVMPLVWTTVGYLLGFRSYVLCAIFLEHACASATGSVPMADAMGCDGALAGEIILIQTALSCITIFCGVYLLRLLAII
jgi:hypothetical protein